MTTTIDYAIRPYMREMYKQHRWGVLSMLMLHANNLNRCWPSIVGIASDLGISPNQVTKAKNWLIEHGAVQLVPYDKRIGKEEMLGPRQLVYQLTGQITIDEQTVSYLHGALNVTVDSNFNVTTSGNIDPDKITANGNFKITDGDIIDGSNGSISSKRIPKKKKEIHIVDSNESTISPPPENGSKQPDEKSAPEKPEPIPETQPTPSEVGLPEEPTPVPESPPKAQPHVALINAHYNGHPDDLRPIGGPNISRNCRVAAAMRDEGITPSQVTLFMADKYPGYRKWAGGNHMAAVMPLEFVARYIKAWLAGDKGKEADYTAFATEDEGDCPDCHRPLPYCVCNVEKPAPIDPLLMKCWQAVSGSLRVILPPKLQVRLQGVKLLEKRGSAIVLAVSNPIFQEDLSRALNNNQLADLVRDLSGGTLTTFEVRLKPVTA